MNNGFVCSCCGEYISEAPLAWHADAPLVWDSISPENRSELGELTPDQCVINDEDFFVKGLVEIPILGSDEVFSWGIWVSLSRSNFERCQRLWEDPARVDEPSYFGWFCNSLPVYPETLHLNTNVHTREVGVRPFVEIQGSEHPLAIEQQNRITMARVQEIASLLHQPKQQEKKKRFWLL